MAKVEVEICNNHLRLNIGIKINMCFVRLNNCCFINIIRGLKNIFFPNYVIDALW